MDLNLGSYISYHSITRRVKLLQGIQNPNEVQEIRQHVSDVISAFIDEESQSGGERYWAKKGELVKSIEQLPEGEKATIMIMSGHEIDRVAAVALLVKKYPHKIGKIIVTSAIGGLDESVLRETSGLSDDEIKMRLSDFKRKNGGEISDGIHVPENTKKLGERYVTQAESMVNFLIKYCGSILFKHGIEIVGDESSVCSISNLTQPFSCGAVTNNDRHIYIVSDGFHELRVVGEYSLNLCTPGVHRNPGVNSFDATIMIDTDDAAKNSDRFSGFLSVESIFRELGGRRGKFSKKGEANIPLSSLRKSTQLPVGYYAGFNEQTKNLLQRGFWSLSSNFVPDDQIKRDSSLQTRFIPQETKDIGPSGWRYTLSRNPDSGKISYEKEKLEV